MVENEKVSPPPFRCKDTIDVEEFIAMKTKDEKKPTHVKATITYQSGRSELLLGSLNKDGVPNVKFQTKLSALRQFPTVTDVKVEKY